MSFGTLNKRMEECETFEKEGTICSGTLKPDNVLMRTPRRPVKADGIQESCPAKEIVARASDRVEEILKTTFRETGGFNNASN